MYGGGTSLTNGADCSGFIMSVYAKFGVSLPHSSGAMAGCGRGVSYSEAMPGDIICYAGHVAIYMGGGQIVHASNAKRRYQDQRKRCIQTDCCSTSCAVIRIIVKIMRVVSEKDMALFCFQ